MCTSATPLSTGVTAGATTAAFTNTIGDPSVVGCSSDNRSSYTGWYTYTTGASGGSLTVSLTHGTIRWAAISMYSGTCGSFTQIACNDLNNSSTEDASITATCLAPSTTYYIMVWSDGLTASNYYGSFTLNTSFTASNDCCNGATVITMNPTAIINSYTGTATGNNSTATADGTSKCFTAVNTVWYTFTAPVTGNYFVEVTAGTMQGPKLSLNTGTCGALTEQDCAGEEAGTIYDSWGTVGTTSPFGYSPYSSYSSAYTTAQACSVTMGTQVTIIIDSYTAVGTFSINVTTLKNDDIAQPLIINTCGFDFAGSTIGGTNCGSGAGAGNKYYNNVDNNTLTVCNGSTGASGGFTPCNGTAGNGEDATACVNGGDVGFGVENDTWFELCVTATSTLTLTFNPITTSCLPAGTTHGLQIALFTGAGNNLTKIDGGFCGMDITSSTVYTEVLAANTCVFIEIDSYNLLTDKSVQCDYTLRADILPACVLPVKLLYFTGTNEQGKIKLDWVTEEEINAGKYVIERSDDGINYSTIITTKAKSNTTQQTSYTAYDENPVINGINYYKLNEYDENGRGGLLSQAFVSNTAGFPKLSVYPNPSNGRININVINFNVPSVRVEIDDVYGNAVWSSSIQLTEGNSLQQIDLSMIEAGMYFVKATDGTNFYKQTLLISKD